MKLFLIFLLIAPFSFSQWSVGASYKINSEIPEQGFGIFVSRNLPYQGATFGIKARAEINLFAQTEDQKFISEDYNIHFIGEFYFRNFNPYYGLGFGYSQTGIEKLSSRSFILTLLIGAGFPVGAFRPYIELQGINHFSEFESSLTEKNISSFQFRGVVGLSISISTLRN